MGQRKRIIFLHAVSNANLKSMKSKFHFICVFCFFKNFSYNEYCLNCSSVGAEPILDFFNRLFTLLFYSLKECVTEYFTRKWEEWDSSLAWWIYFTSFFMDMYCNHFWPFQWWIFLVKEHVQNFYHFISTCFKNLRWYCVRSRCFTIFHNSFVSLLKW